MIAWIGVSTDPPRANDACSASRWMYPFGSWLSPGVFREAPVLKERDVIGLALRREKMPRILRCRSRHFSRRDVEDQRIMGQMIFDLRIHLYQRKECSQTIARLHIRKHFNISSTLVEPQDLLPAFELWCGQLLSGFLEGPREAVKVFIPDLPLSGSVA